MTSKILQEIEERQEFGRALKFILGGVLFQEGVRGNDPLTADVEDVFSTVELLAARSELEAAPFIAAWHPLVEQLDKPKRRSSPFAPHDLERAFRQDLDPQHQSRSPEFPRSVVRFVEELFQTERAGSGEVYAGLRRQMLRALRELVAIADTAVIEYLQPIVDLARRQGDLPLGTLNYDLTVESLANIFGYPLETGIESWSDTGVVAFQDQASD